MFCPECGMEERQANQFCRACGTDLRRVRTAVESPDGITASAMSAREELGRAVAMKIREIQGAEELAAVTAAVLPEIEKFLESPEEKRMRRMRTGMLLSSIGLGTALGIALLGFFVVFKDFDLIFFLGLAGVVTFFIGMGFILNGLLLTVPRKQLTDRSSEAETQRALDGNIRDTNDLRLPEPAEAFSSVTENTTRHLREKEPVLRD